MKILFTRFPLESAHGGAELQTMALMKGLKERDHAVAFLGSCPTLLVMCKQHQVPDAKLEIGIPPVTKWGAISFLWRRKKMQQQLISALNKFKQHGLDTIVMLSLSEKLLLTKPAHDMGIKVYWLEHDSVGRWLTWNPWLRSLRKLSELAHTICVSEMSCKIYEKLGWDRERMTAIPNGIDTARFSKAEEGEQKTSQVTGRITIGCIARLVPEKGLDVLLRAVEDLTSCDVVIVGMGSEKPHLLKLATTLNEEERVRILPRVGDMGKFYRSLDIFVLPSRSHDPFGLVVAEAMLQGTPTVVTDACGIAYQLVNGQDSLVVPAGSVKHLKEAIISLIQESELTQNLARLGQQKALQTFTQDGMIDQYEALFSRS